MWIKVREKSHAQKSNGQPLQSHEPVVSNSCQKKKKKYLKGRIFQSYFSAKADSSFGEWKFSGDTALHFLLPKASNKNKDSLLTKLFTQSNLLSLKQFPFCFLRKSLRISLSPYHLWLGFTLHSTDLKVQKGGIFPLSFFRPMTFLKGFFLFLIFYFFLNNPTLVWERTADWRGIEILVNRW